jgi:alkylation response protein AidB-like acyl-CoA dehydrogenase
VDFAEPEERVMLRSTVAKLASRFGHAYFAEQVRSGGHADELWAELGQAGFLGVHLPEDVGGGAGGIADLAAVAEELATAGCPILLLIVSPAICATTIDRFGTEEQRHRWLPPLAKGELRMSFAITEPEAGSNSHRIATQATRTESGWRLRGTKHYISGIDETQAVLVVARTGPDGGTGAPDDARRRAPLSLFVIDTDAPGLEARPIPMELSLPEKQFVVFFDDVEVAPDRLVGPEGGGLPVLFAGLNPERILGAALEVGIGRYALAKAAEYARTRSVFDVPIGAHQGVAHPLAEAAVAVELAQLATQRAAWLHDQGDPSAGTAANIAKLAAADAALLALDRSIQAHGGNGLASEYGLADLWGLARLLKTAPVSREMILNHVATHVLNLPRSY